MVHFKKVPILPIKNAINKTATDDLQKVNKQAYIIITSEGMQLEMPMLVVKSLIYDIILGTDTLTKINAIIDFKNNKLMCTVSNKEHSVRLLYTSRCV